MNHKIYNKITFTIQELVGLMRGSMDLQYIGDVLHIFLFLRRIDCILAPVQDKMMSFYRENRDVLPVDELEEKLKVITGYDFYNISGLTLSIVASGHDDTLALLQKYLDGFNQDVKKILINLDYMDVIGKLNYVHILQQSMAPFLDVEMTPATLPDNEIWKVYAYINDNIASLCGRSVSEFNTPMGLSELMCNMLFAPVREEIISRRAELSIYDQTCGLGNLIFTAADNITRSISGYKPCQLSLYGQDINSKVLAKTQSVAFLSGYNMNNFCSGDVLYDDKFEHKQFDYILSNFPIGLRWHCSAIKSNNLKYRIGLPKSKDATMLFIQDIISKMKNSARACFITTGNALVGGGFGSGENSVRKYLIDHDMIDCIVALPPVLQETSIPVYLWILTKEKESFRVGTTQFINARNIFKKEYRQYLLSKDNIDEIVNIYKHYQNNVISEIVKNADLGELQLTIEQPIRNDMTFDIDDYDAIKLDKQGHRIADPNKEFTEVVSLNVDADEYFEKKIIPNIDEESWIDYSKTLIGYRFNFNKIFVAFGHRISSLKLKVAEAALMLCHERASSLMEKIKESDKGLFPDSIDGIDTKLKFLAGIHKGVALSRMTFDKEGKAYLIQAKDISDGTVNFNDCKQISEKTYEKYSKNELNEGDILLSTFSKSGKIYYFAGADKPTIASSSLFVIRAGDGIGDLEVYNRYLYKILSSSLLRDYIDSIEVGDGFLSLSIKELGNFSFKLPNPMVQRLSVNSTFSYDDLLEDYNKALINEQKALNSYREVWLNNVLGNGKK